MPSESKPIEELEAPYGTMPPTSKFYIERSADQHSLTLINNNQAITLFIQAPRQMGKSSLMQRVLYRVEQDGSQQPIFVDFQSFPNKYFDDEEIFLREFCLLMSDSLELPEALDQYWQESRTTIYNCSRYLSQYIIPAINGPFILAMDEVDRLLTSPFRNNFFGMLRSWHNRRARDEKLAQMSLFLSSSTEPAPFIDDPHQSPFNVAELILLQDFSEAEVEELNRRYGSPLKPNRINDLMALVNGHPFLTQITLYRIASGGIDFETLQANAVKDTGPFGAHLKYYLMRILQKQEFKEALIEIHRWHSCKNDKTFHRLEGLGLVKRTDQGVIFRNNLYARYFKEQLLNDGSG